MLVLSAKRGLSCGRRMFLLAPYELERPHGGEASLEARRRRCQYSPDRVKSLLLLFYRAAGVIHLASPCSWF